MIGRALAVAAALAVMTTVGGCVSATTKTTAPVLQPALSASLVMASVPPATGHVAWGDPGAPEYGRNDARLNAGGAPSIAAVEWTEVRTRDQTRTDNGRPREFSTTTVRTLQRRLTH